MIQMLIISGIVLSAGVGVMRTSDTHIKQAQGFVGNVQAVSFNRDLQQHLSDADICKQTLSGGSPTTPLENNREIAGGVVNKDGESIYELAVDSSESNYPATHGGQTQPDTTVSQASMDAQNIYNGGVQLRGLKLVDYESKSGYNTQRAFLEVRTQSFVPDEEAAARSYTGYAKNNLVPILVVTLDDQLVTCMSDEGGVAEQAFIDICFDLGGIYDADRMACDDVDETLTQRVINGMCSPTNIDNCVHPYAGKNCNSIAGNTDLFGLNYDNWVINGFNLGGNLSCECIPRTCPNPNTVCYNQPIGSDYCEVDCGVGLKIDDACCLPYGPDPSTVCTGVSFTQTDQCGRTRPETGTKTTGSCSAVDGECGSSVNTCTSPLAAIPIDANNWTCPGQYGGMDASCSIAPENGSCGSSYNTCLSSAAATGGDGTNWTCPGTYGGTDEFCGDTSCLPDGRVVYESADAGCYSTCYSGGAATCTACGNCQPFCSDLSSYCTSACTYQACNYPYNDPQALPQDRTSFEDQCCSGSVSPAKTTITAGACVYTYTCGGSVPAENGSCGSSVNTCNSTAAALPIDANNWTCPGSNGGNDASCNIAGTPGDCGPTLNTCDTTPAAIAIDSSSWTCPGENGGADTFCSTPENGQCGASLNTCTSSPAAIVGDAYNWTCPGRFGGGNAICTLPEDGVCDTTYNQCLSSQAATGGDGTNWTCPGQNGGDPASCQVESLVWRKTCHQIYPANNQGPLGSDKSCPGIGHNEDVIDPSCSTEGQVCTVDTKPGFHELTCMKESDSFSTSDTCTEIPPETPSNVCMDGSPGYSSEAECTAAGNDSCMSVQIAYTPEPTLCMGPTHTIQENTYTCESMWCNFGLPDLCNLNVGDPCTAMGATGYKWGTVVNTASCVSDTNFACGAFSSSCHTNSDCYSGKICRYERSSPTQFTCTPDF